MSKLKVATAISINVKKSKQAVPRPPLVSELTSALATTCAKHQSFPSQSPIIRTSHKRPRTVLGSTVYSFPLF